ncbi:hypothetical protein L1D14_07405 [Vibrio tubiashii]|uniref:hypothetical protein n=1 Tax=Vibrio tubiashii TaxID=29498 RepID=UPI001EFC4147|nr:hypothetical protein [Vibrio tubiashii]MCG9576064.1 hypothetical protein [Vibrio tubiashii]
MQNNDSELHKCKVEISPEQQVALAMVIAVVCIVVLGTFLTPLFDTELAISLNHALIAFLPDSFDSLKFASNDAEVFKKGQLMLSNLPLLPLVLIYPFSYFMVFSTAKERSLLKNALLVIGVYGGFYAMGLLVSELTLSIAK